MIEIDKNKSQPDFDFQCRETNIVFAEIAGLIHGRPVCQRAIKRVSPMMIGTYEAASIAMTFRNQHRTMLTYGWHGAQFSLEIATYNERFTNYRGGEVIAFFSKLWDTADTQPLMIEHGFFLKVIKLLTGVAKRWQCFRVFDRQYRAVQFVEKFVGQFWWKHAGYSSFLMCSAILALSIRLFLSRCAP